MTDSTLPHYWIKLFPYSKIELMNVNGNRDRGGLLQYSILILNDAIVIFLFA